MDLKNIIKDHTIIICENSYKKHLLKEMTNNHLFLDVKFFTKKEFFEEYLFKYDEKAICYVMEKYNIKIEIAKMYLDNLYYIDDLKENNITKIKFLIDLKNDLDSKKYLKYNFDFKTFINKYSIVVAPYPFWENYELDILKKLNCTFLKNEEVNKINEVYEFDKDAEEINFVLKQICKLIIDGVDINHIKLMNVTKENYNELIRMAKFYNIPIDIPIKNTLYSNKIGQEFLSNIDLGIDKEINKIKNEDSKIVNKIINICNKYTFVKNLDTLKKVLSYEFKNNCVEKPKWQNKVEIINIDDYVSDDDYVFLMNFNAGIIPLSFKDEDYIEDSIKDKLNLKNTITKNKEYKIFTIAKIKSINNLTITYKKHDIKKEYYVSPLVDELNLNTIIANDNILQSYSKIYDKINYAKALYNYEKYSINNNLDIYFNTLGDISYQRFDNKFKGIDKNDLRNYLNNEINISYSVLNNYNKCSFRYYIANILKLDKYEDTFESFIGSLFHDVLEKCYAYNLEINDEIENFINKSERNLTDKEIFFINLIKNDIEFCKNVINEQRENIGFDKELYEQLITIDKSKDDYKITFKGFIDKLLYKEDNDNTYIAIIDYKTGNVETNLKYLVYGLYMQLPIYLYLVKKAGLFKNPQVVGFYLQFILNKNIIRNIDKDYVNLKKDNLKLVGYSLDNVHILSSFDSSVANSNLIKGLKLKATGEFYSTSKVLSSTNFDEITNLTEKIIDEDITNIINGKFDINPKSFGYDKNIGCEYCKFKDICFKKNEDEIILEELDNVSFLGGDNNDQMD